MISGPGTTKVTIFFGKYLQVSMMFTSYFPDTRGPWIWNPNFGHQKKIQNEKTSKNVYVIIQWRDIAVYFDWLLFETGMIVFFYNM